MKVIYSIAAKFAGGGIGTTAYNAVAGIHRYGYLQALYCVGYVPTQIDRSLIHIIPTAFLDRVPGVSQAIRYSVKDTLFDWLVARKNLQADIFHGWNGHCLRSLQKAKKAGDITFVERASSHINTYEKLVGEEYRRWGVKAPPVPEATKKKLLAEYELADFINVPSEFAYQSLVENGIPREKLNLLSFGVDVKKFVPQKVKKDGEFVVVFVGQVGFRKGVPYLLEAWKRLGLRGAKLYLVGGEEEVAHDYLQPFKSDPTIEFTGFQPALKYFQKADIFVFPSIEEGSALVNYEALACGLPVITTPNSGSVVRDGLDGFLLPIRDGDALADRIKYFFDHREKVVEMSVLARQRAEEFTWEGYGERLVRVYENKCLKT